MPMIDVYAAGGTFADKHTLATDLARTLMTIEQVPDIPMFRQNTAAFVHDLPADAISKVEGATDYVRVQVLTNAGALDRDKQLAVVRQFTDLVVAATGKSLDRCAHLGVAHRGGRRRLGSGRSREHERRTHRRGARPNRPAARRSWELNGPT